MRSIYMHMMIFFFYIQMIEIVARIVESWLKKEEVWVEMINKLNDR